MTTIKHYPAFMSSSVQSLNAHSPQFSSAALASNPLQPLSHDQVTLRFGASEADQKATQMFEAIEKGNEAAALALVDSANLEKRNKHNSSLLYMASKKGMLELVQALINQGMDVNDQDNPLKNTALMAACEKGHIDIVRYLIAPERKPPANLFLQDADGYTALQSAANGGHLEVARLVYGNTDNINHPENYDKNTALYYAARTNPEVVQFLLEQGADTAILNKQGQSMLWALVDENNNLPDAKTKIAVLDKLLSRPGININQVDHKNQTFLMAAVQAGEVALVRRLLEIPDLNLQMSIPDKRDSQGKEALRLAIGKEKWAPINALFKKKGVQI